MTTTLWDFPSQHYGGAMQGDKDYAGATPSYIVWNLLTRYTREGDLIVDPMAGSGTVVDVARELGRRALGYDLAPVRKEIFRADARKVPLEDEKADFVFIDPPYSDHIEYSKDPHCIGKLSAFEPAYFKEMRKVIAECDRILRPGRCMALYVSDTFQKKRGFVPIGFRLFDLLCEKFRPLDVVAVTRHNRKLARGRWHSEALKGNYFLRGFNYLFIMKKDQARRSR
ncbi:MAG: DNA methylase [Proteobacteria bacterium]|nr:DNA methylase [Pseudomonadota bacterium]